MNRIKKYFCARMKFAGKILAMGIIFVNTFAATAQVAGTKHDLSVYGPGPIKSTDETQICIFCHTPHNAIVNQPLWGHTLSTATYTPYTSKTLTNTIPSTINGSSKLCLSCHDGQVAVNSLANGVTPTMANGANYISGTSNLGTSFLADHPISFQPVTIGNDELLNPQTGTKTGGVVHLDKSGYLQCTSCHDAHKSNRDATTGKFLVGSNDHSAICITCHVKRYWSATSAHEASTGVFTADQGQHTSYGTVAQNGCESCHKPHKAGQAKQLLNASEEATCVGCHKGSTNGGNTATNISNLAAGPFTKTYVHPTFTVSGKHNPIVLSPRTNNPGEAQSDLDQPNRHAECQDCHNGHAAGTRVGVSGNHYNGTASYPTSNISSSLDLTGVWGVDAGVTSSWIAPTQASFTRQDPATYEYQVCYKCHTGYAYSTNPPTSISSGNNGVTTETDQALEFNPNNPSYHGVASAPVPGIKGTFSDPAWTSTSRMYCSDCHAEDDGSTGWTIPARSGPHGSNNPFILRGAWSASTGVNTPSGLCFRCHDVNTFINGNAANTKFSATNYSSDLHQSHLNTHGNTCMNCHVGVPHGWKRPSLIALATDGAPYAVSGVSKIITWNRNSGNYGHDDCSTGTGCHH